MTEIGYCGVKTFSTRALCEVKYQIGACGRYAVLAPRVRMSNLVPYMAIHLDTPHTVQYHTVSTDSTLNSGKTLNHKLA
jgi:hypothetical protein